MTSPGGYTTSQRAFSVSVDGIVGEFGTFTGGRKNKAISKAWNGGATVPDIVSAPPEVDNLTVGRPYNPKRDQQVAERLRLELERAEKRYTVRKQPQVGS